MSDLDLGMLVGEVFTPSEIENLPSLAAFQEEYGTLSEDLRQAIKQTALKSTYFMSKVILGYTQLNPRVHKPMCDFIDGTERYLRRMMLMPRTHFKTTIWTISHTVVLICRDPNVRILMIADTQTNATRFLQEIQQHFEFNEVFRWVFSEIVPENFTKARWSQTEMEVNRTLIAREPTVDAIGAGGGSESRHYDWIKADDLITEKCIRSDVEMDNVIRWSGGLESLLIKQNEHHIDYVGSRKKKGDLYDHVQKSYGAGMEEVPIGPFATALGELAIFTRSAIEDGRVIFPENISLRFLIRLRKTDPQRYHAQYANSPKGTGLNTFNVESLRFWQWTQEKRILCAHEGERLLEVNPKALDVIILFDPSVAEKQMSSKQGIHVVAKGSHPFRIVLESHIGHFPPDEAIELIFELDRKWNPSLVSIEKRGFQGWVKYTIDMIAQLKKYPYPPIIEWPPAGSHKAQWTKEEHIRGLQPVINANLLWIHETHTELLDEIEFYPNIRWDDGLDSLGQALEYWPMSSSLEEVRINRKLEQEFLAAHLFGYQPKEEEWDEQKFLQSFDATGYGIRA